MKSAADAVIEFNRDILKIPNRQLATLGEDEFRHLTLCFREEFEHEFGVAHKAQDIVQCVDALLDGIYFALGGLYKMGLNSDQITACFAAIHEYNMTKKKGQLEKRATGDVADAIKQEGIATPEERIAKILGLL